MTVAYSVIAFAVTLLFVKLSVISGVGTVFAAPIVLIILVGVAVFVGSVLAGAGFLVCSMFSSFVAVVIFILTFAVPVYI